MFCYCRGCPFLWMQEKGNAACGMLIVEIYFAKVGFMDSKWFNWNATGSYTPSLINFWGTLFGGLFTGCRKRKMLHVDS